MMRKRRGRSTRAWQIGLLILLTICIVQVLWWILDEAHYTRLVATRTAALYQQGARAANVFQARGVEPDQVTEIFPFLVQSSDGRRYSVAAAPRAELWQERFHRLNRYGWEGSFFLIVLIAGMAILARTLRQQAELQQRQQNFVAAVSHEFKSPLASLRLSAETLALRNPPLSQHQALVRRILDDLARLERTVFNVLDSTRVDEGRIAYRPKPLPLQPLVQSVLVEQESRASAAGVTFAQDIPDPLTISADPDAVRTVLQNLVDNALNATAAAGGGRVLLRARAAGAAVELEVADNGIGFAPQEAGKLFGKFYRPGDEMVRRVRGSGLGLYLVQGFVTLGKGSVRAASPGPGRGAVFTVSWPIAKPEDA
ncbi:MAG TPA: HAMP domain-containing sensor histidine kinase [Acidobacteriota bacterium]